LFFVGFPTLHQFFPLFIGFPFLRKLSRPSWAFPFFNSFSALHWLHSLSAFLFFVRNQISQATRLFSPGFQVLSASSSEIKNGSRLAIKSMKKKEKTIKAFFYISSLSRKYNEGDEAPWRPHVSHSSSQLEEVFIKITCNDPLLKSNAFFQIV